MSRGHSKLVDVEESYERVVKKLVIMLVGAIFLATTFSLFNVIYNIQPDPYIDEIFHIPQAVKFCNGNYKEWDVKITTLPGLYLLSVGIVKPLQLLLMTDLCTVYGLRAVNVLTALGNFYVIYKIQEKVRGRTPPSKQNLGWLKDVLSAFNLATFPVLYFFSFLYYTDTTSTFMVLLTYLLHLEGKLKYSAITGAVAVLIRQTNIIWLAFFALLQLGDIMKQFLTRHHRVSVTPRLEQSAEFFELTANHLKKTFLAEDYDVLKDLGMKIFRQVGGYMMVCVAFLWFVAWNKGIAVGDRSAHEAVMNIPQVFYYSIFVVAFTPYCVRYVTAFVKNLTRYKKLAAFTCVACIVAVKCNTYVHPYLLADNRHYAFYFWRRLKFDTFARFLWIPFYMLNGYSMMQLLKGNSVVFQVAYFVCVSILLIPQKLLEFRYFILPFLFLRLHYRSQSWLDVIVDCILFATVNAATVYIFMTREFYWQNQSEIQRFVW